MEHRNSTILTTTRALKDRAVRNLGTVSHEFFHAWNVERIRPRSLEPFNFEEANMSGELWFAEGFTSYYGNLLLMRAQVISLDRFAQSLSNTLNVVLNAPGRQFFSPVEMSQQAPFVDAARSVDPKNYENTFISYYTYGYAIALGLDLTIRQRFSNLSLDGFMREVWRQHGKTEKPYTNEDLRQILGEFTGDQDFSDRFFQSYIYSRELVDYTSLLTQAGMTLRQKDETKAWLGNARLSNQDGSVTVNSSTRIGSPLYLAGVDRQDVILELDGKTFEKPEELEELLKDYNPEDTVSIKYEKNGVEKTVDLALQSDPALEAVPYEHDNQEITTEVANISEKNG
jgi:predicted metalloprotease with PDZ domain